RILRAAVEQYAAVAYRCAEVITDNVTAAGEAFSRRYGFRELLRSDHDSTVYTQSWADFVKRI
ncbi:MAG: hypothetical protein IKC90_09305, partial [Akkermansia sp.]|nr:hypothetical protein [Akkermansia sp.]